MLSVHRALGAVYVQAHVVGSTRWLYNRLRLRRVLSVAAVCVRLTDTVYFELGRCKLVEVHCDRYAFNLKYQPPFSVMMSYRNIQRI